MNNNSCNRIEMNKLVYLRAFNPCGTRVSVKHQILPLTGKAAAFSDLLTCLWELRAEVGIGLSLGHLSLRNTNLKEQSENPKDDLYWNDQHRSFTKNLKA